MQRRAGHLNLVLNRPRVLNTLNLETIRRLRRALDEAREDDGVRLIVLAGAGDRGFCAGGDLKELLWAVKAGPITGRTSFSGKNIDWTCWSTGFPSRWWCWPTASPWGAAWDWPPGADFVVATERSRMAMPETRIGFFPDVGATGWLFANVRRAIPNTWRSPATSWPGRNPSAWGWPRTWCHPRTLAELGEDLVEISAGLPTGCGGGGAAIEGVVGRLRRQGSARPGRSWTPGWRSILPENGL